MKILVATETYPNANKPYSNPYVHTRSLAYRDAGNEVAVLSFTAEEEYVIDGIPVVTRTHSPFDHACRSPDLLVLHAPNLRNHVRYCASKVPMGFPLVAFFHGHEVLRTREFYPRPYSFDAKGRVRHALQSAYDPFKLAVMSRFLRRRVGRGGATLVFVSDWMLEAAVESLCLDPDLESLLRSRSVIIPNSVHPAFLESAYVSAQPVDADCVTIRPLDRPKYAVDRVLALAWNNPSLTFHVYGTGRLERFVEIPPNVTIDHRFFPQAEIPDLLKRYRMAVMPTRLDAQGVMACEMATFGIPLLTSDIPICREMLSAFPRVRFWNHEDDTVDMRPLIRDAANAALPDQARRRYAFCTTVGRELRLFAAVVGKRGAV